MKKYKSASKIFALSGSDIARRQASGVTCSFGGLLLCTPSPWGKNTRNPTYSKVDVNLRLKRLSASEKYEPPR